MSATTSRSRRWWRIAERSVTRAPPLTGRAAQPPYRAHRGEGGADFTCGDGNSPAVAHTSSAAATARTSAVIRTRPHPDGGENARRSPRMTRPSSRGCTAVPVTNWLHISLDISQTLDKAVWESRYCFDLLGVPYRIRTGVA